MSRFDPDDYLLLAPPDERPAEEGARDIEGAEKDLKDGLEYVRGAVTLGE